MASRRTARILIVVGIVLVVAGLFSIFYAMLPAGSRDTAALLPNDLTTQTEYYSEYSWSVLSGGTVQGTFTVTNGTPVDVFVFNDADYNAWVNGQNLTGLYNATAASGTLNLQVSGWNTYHIVFAHGPGYGGQEQDVSVDLTSTGTDPGFFLGGIAAAAIGIVLAAFAVLLLRRPAEHPPSGVLESRATYMPPPAPSSGPDMTTTGGGMYRVPPPLPGTEDASSTTAGPAPLSAPTGDVVVTLENRSAAPETVQLVVNGVAVTAITVSPGTTQTSSVTARLASPFGSMVTVQAVTADGKKVERSVFVGAHGTAQVSLQVN